MSQADSVTAGLLVIGDEILSGRTKDVNIGATADFCTDLGIDLKEVRMVSDETDDIVEAVNALRARYTYVFTTGGIGPTHDDITADAVAKAFGVPVGPGGEVKKTIDGKEEVLKRGVTAKRWTFVIGKDGKVAAKNTEVKAAEDSKAILDLVGKL